MNLVSVNSKIIINMDNVSDIEYTPAKDAFFDEDDCREYPARPAMVTITTTAVDFEVQEYDYGQFSAAGGCKARKIVVRGDEAENLWKYLESRCGVPMLDDNESFATFPDHEPAGMLA